MRKAIVHATPENTKTILDLLEDQGVSLPCNCHGANSCGGAQYDFPCGLVPHEDLSVTLRDTGKICSLDLGTSSPEAHLPDTLFIDLGTTTVSMVFYHTETKTIWKSETFSNPQIPYGTDVISRIKYDTDFHEDYSLKHVICHKIKNVWTQSARRFPQLSLRRCLIGGNTTMIHLLLGDSLDSMATAPFTPAVRTNFSFWQDETHIYIVPWLSAFIGGDIVSGLLWLNFDRRQDTCILADLGTNGELALCHNGTVYTASAAAGPAFEGSGISCGCPAIPGAISDVTLGGVLPRIRTISNKLPTGICGSGAVSILAELIAKGYLDSEGAATDKFSEEGLLISKDSSANPILFTRQDARQMQLATAAIGAGIDCLCHRANISVSQVDHLYLAGGLGYHIPVKKAALTGLFSEIPICRVSAIGNSCLMGLAQLAADLSSRQDPDQRIQHLRDHSCEVVLAQEDLFQQNFLRHMHYPAASEKR